MSSLPLVIASNNRKKRHEIAAVLAECGVTLLPVDEVIMVDVVEDGDSFAANAAKKAEAFAVANRLPALADDSGLCVEVLGGAPGIYSSRYAGVDGDDRANNEKLLHVLQGEERRAAYFICHLH
ncbi:MAG: non-canonical purine NTP pyrophosphatase, partial [Mariprofundales bacterium]|nr:non-canonical purine NTP pyrophosphatase [Mariprofundales bacterium]